jgi:hypothetical protein
MLSTIPRLKPIPAFIREDSPFERTKAYRLIRSGEIKTVAFGKRRYVDMLAWNAFIDGAPK